MTRKARIVSIIDDELEITVLFYDALHSIREIKLFKFTDPIMALEHFKIHYKEYGVVISDLRMPGINGIDLLKSIKELNPLVRTVLMTAFEPEDKIFQLHSETQIINAFLQKPISLNNLVKEIENQLTLYQSQEHRARSQ